MSFILSELMESTWLAMFLLGFLMLGGGGWSEGCLEEERVALSRLKPFFPFIDYYTTEFGEKESPLVDCCKWERVECNPTTGRLTHLFLNLSHIDYDSYDYEYNTKSWYLNASLFLPFEELQFLSLTGNSIAGCVADQGFEKLSSRLNKLEILDLSFNYFNDSILASISELSSLKSLSLRENQFTLVNPTNGIKMLSKLNNLETLNLFRNSLGNTIMSQLHDLTSLKSLNLQSCGLKGSVNLLEFDILKNLKELYLDYNGIEGIESSFQEKGQLRLNKLEVLGLAGNQFTNDIFSSLAAIPNLKSLDLSLNNLNGTIDVKDLNAFSNLEELFLWGNGVTELVPPQELRLMNLKVLDLGYNPLDTSILATLGRFSNLKTLSFRITQLNGSIDIKEMAGLSNLENLDMSCYSDRVCNISLQPLNLFSSLKTHSLHGFNFKETRVHSHSQNKWQNLTNLEELELWDSSLPSNFIGTLPSLKRLFIYDCYLDDSLLQDPFKLKNLEILNIYNTYLGNNFLQKLGAMPSLKILSLRNCELDGTEVQGFCGLTNLRELDLSYNQLKGNLSECISNFTSLERLDLSSNHFSGDVSVFESLTSLKVLTLSNNYFQIPSSLGPFFNLSELKVFSADNNTIYVESEMQSLVPTFQLNSISLSFCGDGGQIPQFLYHQHDLRVVDLSNMNLKGDFPNWLLQNNTNLKRLYLANNSLLGPVKLPFLPHTYLSYLDISKNFFNGKVPLEIGAKLPSLWFLNMSKNHFHGSIPASIGDMNSLQELDLSDNQLSGGLPKHLFMGCSLLFSLTLSNNSLQGQIPYSLSNCSQLSTLDVSNNQLSGEIPRWMGSMSSLSEIMMANNHLAGPFPVEFCHLNRLKLLDLSMNNISGYIPSCFSPLRISQVHLSKNKLQGPLTNAFRNSTILVTLDLSNNHLTGQIPNWIGNLSQLSFLLLNNNHFEGRIPVQLCNLGHLSLIDLSNNNLSGTIPSCLKITTWNEISQEYARYVSDVEKVNGSFSIDEPIEFTSKNKSYSYKGRVLTYLSGIDLSCNKLTGEIPRQVKNFRNIYALNLSHNSLIGPIPLALSDLKQIESLDLSHNNLSGTIPPQLMYMQICSMFHFIVTWKSMYMH